MEGLRKTKPAKWLCFFLALLLTLTCFTPFARAEENTSQEAGNTVLADTAQPEAQAVSEEKGTPSLKQDAEGNYLIGSVEDLNTLRADIVRDIEYENEHLLLTADIDAGNLTPYPELPPTDEPYTTSEGLFGYIFRGKLNGMGHKIYNFKDSGSGLFDVLAPGAQIGNLTVEANVNFTKDTKKLRSSTYGVIANMMPGAWIQRCATTGSVTIQSDYQGYVGFSGMVDFANPPKEANVSNSSEYKGTIEDSYSTIVFTNNTQSSANFYGIGPGVQVLKNCFFAGSFKGKVNKEISQPLARMSTANENMESCYFDSLKISTLPANAQGEKVPTYKMRSQETFKGWDFGQIWKMGDDHPVLNTGYTILKDKVILDTEVVLEPRVYSEALGGDSTLTRVQDIKIKTDLGGNPHQVTIDYEETPDTKNTFYVGMMGDHARGLAQFDKVEVKYTENDEAEYYLPSDFYKYADRKQAEAWGSFTQDGTVLSDDQKQELIDQAKKACDLIFDYKLGSTPDAATVASDSWLVFSAARCNYKVPDGFWDQVYKQYEARYAAYKAQGQVDGFDTSDTAKDVLAISAIGYDPRNVGGYDLLDVIINHSGDRDYFASQTAAFAMYSNDFDESQYGYSMADYVKSKVTPIEVDADGVKVEKDQAADMWTMAWQPLMFFYDPNAQEGSEWYDLKLFVEDGLNQISAAQTYMGNCWGGYINSADSTGKPKYDITNTWTNAQVQISVGLAGIDPFDARFVKNGNTLITRAVSFFEGGQVGGDVKGGESAQVARGLNSIIRAYEQNPHNLFDCRDVEDSTVQINNAIGALPEAAAITEEKRQDFDQCWEQYNKLNDTQKSNISNTNKEKLQAIYEKFYPDENLESALELAKTELSKSNVSEIYTQDSINNLKAAVEAAEKVQKDTQATSEQKAEQASKLRKAVEALVTTEAEDMKKVETAIDQIKPFTTLEGRKPVDTAKDLYDKLKYDESRERIKNRDTLLSNVTAVEGLEAAGDSLKAAIAAAKEQLAQTDKYLASSIEAARQYITIAEKVDVQTSTVQELANAQITLERYVNDTLKEQPDKTELNNKIAEITEKMKALDEKDYSAEKWKTLEDALSTAKDVAESNDADGGAVTSAIEGLDNAFNGLEEDVMLGDVNGDGEVTARDALMVMRAVNGKVNLTETQKKAADVVADGEITARDALLIQKVVNGKASFK
ncbi:MULTISPECIES: dockerin type I repeat-containing protein [Eubacterium]|uniref:dockerin type I repeat-containing protein n=1 Tax=Eubacterium TaxID=1730 RepID=UPI001313F3F4|nr:MULTISPECIES: dockerin type I repeat-containing protein [Eubacterium]